MNKFFTFNYFHHTYMLLFCLKNANIAVHAHAEIQDSVYFFKSTHSCSVFLIMVSLGYRTEALGVAFPP